MLLKNYVESEGKLKKLKIFVHMYLCSTVLILVMIGEQNSIVVGTININHSDVIMKCTFTILLYQNKNYQYRNQKTNVIFYFNDKFYIVGFRQTQEYIS